VHRSDTLRFTTSVLPEPLQGARLEITGQASPGYYLTAFYGPNGRSNWIVAFDARGEVAWYRTFADTLPALDAGQHPNGHYTVYLGRSTGSQPLRGRFVEFTAAGDSVRSYELPLPYFVDPHEMKLTADPDTAAHYIGYEFREVDLRAGGGPPNAVIVGHVVVRQRTSGAIAFLWRSLDHLPVENYLLGRSPGLPFDYGHANAIAFDVDGNCLVSFFELNEVTKVHASDRRSTLAARRPAQRVPLH